jgi:FkbM family methyltransferase
MAQYSVGELAGEYERIEAIADAEGRGPGRATTLGWDLEYTSPDAVLAFLDQILFRRMNDFIAEDDAPLILDCGANIGYTVLHYLREFPRARIIAFEPDPQFLPILERNLARNLASHVEVVGAAAWTREGRARWVAEQKDGSRLAGPGACAGATAEVATIDLARYLDRHVDLLKIDIEGAEFTVVQHIAPRLDRVQNVLVECHIAGQSAFAGLTQVLGTLGRAGFRISVNSFGPWRDLTRRHVAPPLHAEQYLIVAGWRSEHPSVSQESTYAPYVGLPYFRDLLRAESRCRQSVRRSVRAFTALAQGDPTFAAHPMTGPFAHDENRCWTWRAPCLRGDGDSSTLSESSTVVVEDGAMLGPAHALHADIRTTGGGLYSHWGDALYFSTTDGTDPNTNGRRYSVVCRRDS